MAIHLEPSVRSNVEHQNMGGQGEAPLEDDFLIKPARTVELGADSQSDVHLKMHEKFVLHQAFTNNPHYLAMDSRNYQLNGLPIDGLNAKDAAAAVAEDIAAAKQLRYTPEYKFALIRMAENSMRHENYHQELGRESADLSMEVGGAWEMFSNELENAKENGIDAKSRGLPESGGISAVIGGSESAPVEGEVDSTQMRVMAPYWLNGLHNKEGIDIANQLNKFIMENKLAEDKEAILRLLSAQEKARKLGLEAVLEQVYLNDLHYRDNIAEPRKLVGGNLVRDKDGAYRPAGGGNPVLLDKGDALALKSKGPEAYRGAMELALAKGWTAIELKGSPKMMADAWLEAKLLNLTVANYKPTEKDQEKFAQRLAEMRKQRGEFESRPIQQAPEMVEIRPFVNELGQTQMATVTYTVTFEGGKDVPFDNAKNAASAFHEFSGASPVVIRSVTRADGIVQESVVAGEDIRTRKGTNGKVLERLEDREFSEALGEVLERVNAAAVLKETGAITVSDGIHVGNIIAVDAERGRMLQKNGRGHVWHDIAKMKGVVPKVGEMAQIEYKKNMAYVKEKEKKALEQGDGIER